jgi:hypothetical protein
MEPTPEEISTFNNQTKFGFEQTPSMPKQRSLPPENLVKHCNQEVFHLFLFLFWDFHSLFFD